MSLAGSSVQNRREPIDVVYTWVDDSWPGYLELASQYANTPHDKNPNRTRDNIDVLRYSLRSLCKYMPWVRNIYLFSMRPQIPPWLNVDHPRIHIVHHDEVMPPEVVPTFNSFAILSYMHLLKGLSERFIYICDDFLMGAPVEIGDLIDANNKDAMYFKPAFAPNPSHMHSDKKSPWDAGRAYTNSLLDTEYGFKKRYDVGHVPTLFRRFILQEMIEKWPEDVTRTRQCRFRAKYNVVPEFMYPHYAVQKEIAVALPRKTYRESAHYVSIENSGLKARFDTWLLKSRNPKFFALNDSFGQTPNPRVEQRWRDCLSQLYPDACEFEKSYDETI
jgi:hypothetical protein